jgi:GNAT superfamily N-acetyltransferase
MAKHAPNQITVGPLKKKELAEADRIFRIAFGAFLGIPDPSTFMGDRDLVASRFGGNHVKALAAREDSRLIGFNILTFWGSFAFFGPLCVLPEYWSKGVAQQLMKASVDMFDEMNLPRTGLFTFAQSAKHVGLYNKFGYWPQQLTAMFHYKPSAAKDLKPEPGTTVLHLSKRWHATLEESLTACRKLTDRIDKGLDLTEEIRSILKQDIGEVILIFLRKTFEGFAIACTGRGSEGGKEICYIKFAAVRGGAGADARFDRLLNACDDFALSHNVDVEFGVNFACQAAYRRIRARGVRPTSQGVAMLRPNLPGLNRPDAFVINDWR